jgi:hypothetical protein
VNRFFGQFGDQLTATEKALLAPAAFRILRSADRYPQAANDFIRTALHFVGQKPNCNQARLDEIKVSFNQWLKGKFD